jgi:glycerol-3-phosphate acyltransferase PlsY
MVEPAVVAHRLALLIPVAYLCGSVPFGLLVGLARGVDVRQVFSRNIGATNVGRALGRKYFLLTLLLDGLKGLLPMLAGWLVVRQAAAVPSTAEYGLWAGIGLAAVLGHTYSVFLRFTGGKGVATTAGVVLGLWPFYTLPCVVMVATFLLVRAVTGYVSVGSMCGALAFPVSYVALGLTFGWGPFGPQWPLTLFSVVVAALVVYKHRANIARLRAGTEPRASRRHDPPST